MNMEELKKIPELPQIIGNYMHTQSKKEQQEKAKNYKILNETVKKGQILFTGSSLMEQFPINEIAQNHNLGKVIYNRGIGGFNTDDFLSEIDTVLFDLEPAKIFINIGTNDINEQQFGPDWKEHLLQNYENILQQIQNRLPDAEVYMLAYYPVNATVADEHIKKFMLATRTNSCLDQVNADLESLARKYHLHFIDANDGLRDDNHELKAELTKEGVHMYANAYEIVYHNLEAYL